MLAENASSEQRDCSEMTRGLTYINEVCEQKKDVLNTFIRCM